MTTTPSLAQRLSSIVPAAEPITAERERQEDMAFRAEGLKAIDQSLTDVATALHRIREVRKLAKDLDQVNPASLVIRTYDLEEPWEEKSTDLGLAGSAQGALSGDYREPVRELIAATHAAEALLVSYAAQAEEDHARLELELRDLRG